MKTIIAVKRGNTTIKIYRHKGRRYKRKQYELFTVAYRLNGKQLRKNFSRYKDAWDFASHTATALVEGCAPGFVFGRGRQAELYRREKFAAAVRHSVGIYALKGHFGTCGCAKKGPRSGWGILSMNFWQQNRTLAILIDTLKRCGLI